MPSSKSRNSPFDTQNERGGDRLLQIEAVYDKVPVGLCYLNRDGIFVTVNDQLSRMLDVSSDLAVGRSVEDVVPDHAALLRASLIAALKEKPIPDHTMQRGAETLMISAAPVTNDLGEVAGISVAYTNITTMTKISERLAEIEQRTTYALESAGQWIWDMNIATNRVWRSPQYRTLLGLDPASPAAENVAWDIVHPDDKARTIQAFEDVVSGRKPHFEAVYRVPRGNGGEAWILSRGKIVEYGPDGSPLRLLATSVDISSQKQIEEELSSTVRLRMELEQKLLEANRKLKKLSESDHLTSLPNRRKFSRLLKREYERASDHGQPLALLMIDIDYFKAYNDVYGHLAGDRCLVQVGRVLSKVIGKGTGVVARFGGEEFAALLPGASIDEAADIAATLLEAVASLHLDQEDVPAGRTSVSIGISALAQLPAATQDGADALVNLADRALYEAKRAGRGRVRVWGSFSTD
jgi:diguanylate cyclase (GGDEF)-like protein/PAS domain S-box-containing protein